MRGYVRYELPASCPRLDYAGLAAWLCGETDRAIRPGIMVRKYSGPVISIELRGHWLAFIRPGSVRFAGATWHNMPSAGVLADRIVTDNGLGAGVSRVRLGGPGRARLLAIDGDRGRLLPGNTYDIPQQSGQPENTEQEIAS